MRNNKKSISFKRNGAVIRDGIRVGWIERRDDYGPVEWRLRFTPASGFPGVFRDYEKLSDAKKAASEKLSETVAFEAAA